VPLRRTAVGLLLCVALGCSARTDIDLTPDDETEPEEEEDLPECAADLTPRVEDCARPAAPDAVPIANLFHPSLILADDEFLYYASDLRAFRLSMSGGEPEALTPPDSVSGTLKYLVDGFLYWRNDGTVLRVRTTGGEPEAVVEIIPDAVWALAGQDVIWGGPSEPSPVYRTSSISGETTEILAEDPDEKLKIINVAAGHALVTLDHSLVAIPLAGGEPRVLAKGGMGAGTRPIVHDGLVYFGATISMVQGEVSPELGPAIWRVDLEEPSKPELFLSGFAVAFAFDDDALYAHIIPENPPGGSAAGRIVRAPLSGGDALEITGTSSRSLGTGPVHGPYVTPSNALVVSGCNVYFAEPCSIEPTHDFRLVTMSKVP
jgi:hypothetical protein